MRDYNSKVIKGDEVRGDQLRLPRARSIYMAALRHPLVNDVQCRINSDGDEIVLMRLIQLEVPDEPVKDIHDEEDVAVVCHKEDVFIPEVYALRKDFPTELPHSNASPFAHPVSMCVSDVPFADIRPQFNAFDFIGLIRRWLNLNSINQLHESNRPLEVFFGFHEACCFMNERVDVNPYVRYSKRSKFSSTLEYVEKGQATHYLVSLPTERIYTRNFARIPQTMGDLQSIPSTAGLTLTDSLQVVLFKSVAGKAALPLALMIFITQLSEDSEKTSQNLFLIKTTCTPREIVQKKNILSDKAFEQWFFALPVEVVLLDLMTSRDRNALNNGIKESFKKIGVVGAGTLGSAVIDHFVREGCSEEVAIVDFDILLPHNISRHTLTTDKVMTSKVRSIKEAYRGILFQNIAAVEGNIFTLTPHDADRLYKGTELIIDVSTSIAVERLLAREDKSFRRCTSFMNPKGDDIVLMMEDKCREHRLDLLEMDYYRSLIVDERFAHHLEQTEIVLTNTFSCRSESMVLNYENVRLLSAIVSNQIRKYYKEENACLNIWHFDAENGEVSCLPMAIAEWRCETINGVRVYLSSEVEQEINSQAKGSVDKETGGCLFGSYDRDSNSIYVYYMVPAPDDSIHSPISFIRGFRGLTEEYERITALTYHQVRYLGEWHSHPNMSNAPSGTDKKQFDELWAEQQSQDLPFVQMIHGNNGLYVKAAM